MNASSDQLARTRDRGHAAGCGIAATGRGLSVARSPRAAGPGCKQRPDLAGRPRRDRAELPHPAPGTAYHGRKIAGYADGVPDQPTVRDAPEADSAAPTRADFERLLAFRTSLRRFQRWSEAEAAAVGLTSVQHQLLLAIKGHPGTAAPTIGDIAGYLLLRHHSAVELVDRTAEGGFVRRISDPADARVVRVQLTARGERRLVELTNGHLEELHKLAAVLNDLVTGAHAAEAVGSGS
jgi:DNA-binding MarR family transcriptional regulator